MEPPYSAYGDDGFAAYINGKLVHQQNITGTPGPALCNFAHFRAGIFDISTHIGALKPGTNISLFMA